jgi:hypothetical protein
MKQFATAVASVLICVSTACTTLSPVAADATGARIRAEIKVGDTVRVLTADGTTHRFEVSAVGESSLFGNAVGTWKSGADAAGSRIEVPYRDIQQIEVQHVSGFKTTGIVAVVGLVAAVAIASGGGSHTPGFTR